MEKALSPLYLQGGNIGGPYAVHPGSIQLHPKVQNQGNQSVVIIQPSPNMRHHPPAKPVPDYTGYSIFTTLCCCLCLGLCALYYSRATHTADTAGQRRKAACNSQIALILNHVALLVGLMFLGVYLLQDFYLSDEIYNP